MIRVDYAIIGIITLSTLIGFMRGFLREVVSFVIWLSALFVAWAFYQELAVELMHWATNPSLRLGTAFLILTLSVLVLGALLNHLLYALLERKKLTGRPRGSPWWPCWYSSGHSHPCRTTIGGGNRP